jgi:serine/threonine protein kinase
LDNLLETSCGTASYAPPEMHKGNKYFGLLTDVWSAGIVLYIMNFGYLPFCEEN